MRRFRTTPTLVPEVAPRFWVGAVRYRSVRILTRKGRLDMGFRVPAWILAVALSLSATAAWAVYTGEADALLNEEEVAQLPEAAKGPYTRAVERFDHIDRDTGVQLLVEAAKAAPDYVPLQFLLANRARDRARFHYGVRALEYYDIAEEAAQRILQQPLLSLEEKRRAEQLLGIIQDERETLPTREKKMIESGFEAIVIPLAIRRSETMGKEFTPKEINKAMGKAQAQAEGGEASTAAPSSGAAAAEFPTMGEGVVLPSYALPTEQPAQPAGQQRGQGYYPGYQPYYGQPLEPGMPGGPPIF